jgi:hypothetical protein
MLRQGRVEREGPACSGEKQAGPKDRQEGTWQGTLTV